MTDHNFNLLTWLADHAWAMIAATFIWLAKVNERLAKLESAHQDCVDARAEASEAIAVLRRETQHGFDETRMELRGVSSKIDYIAGYIKASENERGTTGGV